MAPLVVSVDVPMRVCHSHVSVLHFLMSERSVLGLLAGPEETGNMKALGCVFPCL